MLPGGLRFIGQQLGQANTIDSNECGRGGTPTKARTISWEWNHALSFASRKDYFPSRNLYIRDSRSRAPIMATLELVFHTNI